VEYKERTRHASDGLLINSLKDRVRELEEQSGGGSGDVKCLVCLGAHESPLVSINCWHVVCIV
jgi:hypothetical protein